MMTTKDFIVRLTGKGSCKKDLTGGGDWGNLPGINLVVASL
ncbi:MAG: hypothetical protein ACYTE5_00500 [Planctomycetota bacterium]